MRAGRGRLDMSCGEAIGVVPGGAQRKPSKASEHTDLLIGLGEKVACVLHRHPALPQSSSASRFTAGAFGFLT
jgi:hypothetical protein